MLYLNLDLKAHLWLMQLSFQVRKLTTFITFKIKADCNFGKFQALFFFFFFLRKVSFNTVRPTWSPYFHIKFCPWSYLPTLSHCTFMLSHFSCVQLFATPLTAACQIPLSMGFSRQEYWNGLPCPPYISCIGRWILYCLSHQWSPQK